MWAEHQLTQTRLAIEARPKLDRELKRAEVRRAAEIMWAEHQLTQTRLAIEARPKLDRQDRHDQ